MLDTRRHLERFINGEYKIALPYVFIAFLLSFLFAYFVAFLPTYQLSQKGVFTLFILLFAAALWASEAIPAFAVSLLVIALEIILLGFDDFNFSSNSKEWQYYLEPWSSPLIFLFLAGFIMAEAASKTKLDLWFAKRVLFFAGEEPKNIITAIMSITFILSMFVSNTATAAMMMSVLSPLLLSIKSNNPLRKALLLSVVIGANIGGMATIIGTPPNAIAVGMLKDNAPSFMEWIIIAMPPAVMMVFLMRLLIIKFYPSNQTYINLDALDGIEDDDGTAKESAKDLLPSWKKQIVILIFFITISLWLTSALHHIPTTVVSLLPIVAFTLFGIIDADDIRSIRWDVIILIIGGLSLGLGVSKYGLDVWFASLISSDGLSVLMVLGVFSYIVVVISNFMSNTAATNIMLPIVIAIVTTLSSDSSQIAAIAVALSASFAMSLPVSTPPNAIIYASGIVKSKDFLFIGVVTALIGPIFVLGWLSIYFG
ncbi:Sodium/sulphate symporter [Sulfurimonas denitrificans DSM 1251]|uniref:Sodium/sulphate symporter n=1 Tax=Sulfurimonas denitrificans (strain ATCC 33889 / DSM 1251) TaxID=326298 RepID=Q30RF8_SULDN|nr:DASS family sodium-coupled anion symporter [Sulfurimonas denitrificans]ABB44423.1 Sodium/sulphate symporter [Sulfurimonas denitrificans DSM 1251]MDD3442962.1 DASS family sodium-coupled anion symporter [Sulfurimonas denitrificans]